MKRPNGQARSGQDRSGQVWSGQAMQSFWTWKCIYNIQHAIQKLPTKFHVNQPIEPRVITVDTQIASGHLNIFAIYLHIETGISKSYKVPAILFGTIHGDVLRMICAKHCWFSRRRKYLKMCFSTSNLKGQRSWSFRDLNIDGWILNIILVVVLAV